MAYPLFDTGYTLWAADLETRLMETHGTSPRALGVEPRHLMERYYQGESVTAAMDHITRRYLMPAR